MSLRYIKAGSAESDGNRSHDYSVLADSLDQVEKWVNENYYLEESEKDQSSELDIMYSLDGTYDENGNTIEWSDELIDPETDELKEGYYYQTDFLEVFGSELTQEDYEYFKQGKHFTSVIDLTEDN